jgi:hypothetical protein
VPVAGVVGNPVEQAAHPAVVAVGQEPVEGGEVPEHRVDVAVVADVVPAIGHGRSVDGREPDGVDSQPFEVLEQNVMGASIRSRL